MTSGRLPGYTKIIPFGITLLLLLISISSISVRGDPEEDPDLYEIMIPGIGTPFTDFTFNLSVNTSAVGDPDSVMIRIDNITYNMTREGDHFLFNTDLLPGNHTHSYILNISGNLIYHPESGSLQGPYVLNTTENTAPVLSDGLVDPAEGNYTSLFHYYVNYTDIDNDPPASVMVFINGTAYNMTRYWGFDYTQGVWYRIRLNLPLGNKSYKFYASDGYGDAILPHNLSFNGPTILDPYPDVPVEKEDRTKNAIIITFALLIAVVITAVLITMSFTSRNFTESPRSEKKERPKAPPSPDNKA